MITEMFMIACEYKGRLVFFQSAQLGKSDGPTGFYSSNMAGARVYSSKTSARAVLKNMSSWCHPPKYTKSGPPFIVVVEAKPIAVIHV